MKAMISQPMKGKTEEQIRKERKKIVDKLEELGWEVVDTIFAEEAPKNCDVALYYLSKSIEAIGKVDVKLNTKSVNNMVNLQCTNMKFKEEE